jgi:DNA repair protein RecN (Recombination protein N)
MLQTLRVKNLAVVEDATVEFEAGLNVITGETGAGKSILIGALGLLLGERADRQSIRSGRSQCMVQAQFQLKDADRANRLCEATGLEPCDHGALIVSRTVLAAGGGKIFVNGTPATLPSLKALGDILLDMHGPHEHQSILRQDFQMDLLDAFGDHGEVLDRYRAQYAQLAERRAEAEALQGDGPDLATQKDLLAWQIREIEEAELEGTDEAQIQEEHAVAAHARRIAELIQGALEALTEGDHSAFAGLSFTQKALDEMSRLTRQAHEWLDEARSVAIRIQELADTLNRYGQNVDCDPQRLEWLESRMAALHRLKRKYGSSVHDILSSLERARKQLYDMEHREERMAELAEWIRNAEAGLRETGARLSALRRKSARALSAAVSEHLRDLGFPHGGFSVQVQAAEAKSSGMDDVEFGFAPNVGETMRPLRKIASSGEISRVMLALKVVLSDHDRIPVLVFDEIDSNVGGEMGAAIGEKLARVARQRQAICITHLPQVASYGTTHWVVTKEVEEGRTHSRIRAVGGREREAEIARMLSGRTITDTTVRHAREMLQRASS